MENNIKGLEDIYELLNSFDALKLPDNLLLTFPIPRLIFNKICRQLWNRGETYIDLSPYTEITIHRKGYNLQIIDKNYHSFKPTKFD